MHPSHPAILSFLPYSRSLLVGCALAVVSGLWAAPAAGAQTIVAIGDAFVLKQSASNVMGGNSLMVSSRTGNYARKTYLSFDLSSLSSVTVDAASSLSLGFVSLSGPASGSVTLYVYGITDSTATFDESAITWNNAPKNNTDHYTDFSSSGVALLGTITVDSASITQGTTVSLSGAGLADFLNWALGNSGDYYNTGATSATGGMVTIMLGSDPAYANKDTNPGINFYSKEASVASSLKPHLDLVTSPIPEPAAAAFTVGLVSLVVVSLRRRSLRKPSL